MSSTDTKQLEKRAKELRQVIERPSEQERAAQELAAIERQVAEQQAAGAKAAAEERMVGIARAHGSLRDQYQADQERLRDAVAAVGAAVGTINDRYRKLLDLELEAKDLAADHGIALAKLPPVLPPALTGTADADVALAGPSARRRAERAHQRGREKKAGHVRTRPVALAPLNDLGVAAIQRAAAALPGSLAGGI